jgi:D-alanine transaminase
MDRVYLNGRFVAREEACIPVTDRGLLFADSVYEVIPAYAGVPFRAHQHLDRLQRSLAGIRLPDPMSREEWLDMIGALCRGCPSRDQSIYIQVTRGSYPARTLRVPQQVEPNVIAFVSPIPERDPRIAEEGLKAITLADIRWHRCDIKSTNLLANILAQAQAVEKQVDDAIFIRDGIAKEGTASNLFIVLDGLLLTPPNSDELLPGVTRDLVMELAAEAGIAHAEASISETDLYAAEEIWLTSSTREVAPVVRLNDRPVGNGRPGGHWRRMDQLYQAAKARIRLQARSGVNI